VPDPTFAKLLFQFRLRIWTIKAQLKQKFGKKSCLFIFLSFFTKKKLISFFKFSVKCEWKKLKMKEIKYTILHCVFVRTFVITFYYASGTINNYGSGSGSGSNFLTIYVTVPTVRVPQHCFLAHSSRSGSESGNSSKYGSWSTILASRLIVWKEFIYKSYFCFFITLTFTTVLCRKRGKLYYFSI
jgi:hypothetical protein